MDKIGDRLPAVKLADVGRIEIQGRKVWRIYLIIPAEASDDVTGLGDEQKVVHVLQGLVADAVTPAVPALRLARVVRTLLRAALHLGAKQQQPARSRSGLRNEDVLARAGILGTSGRLSRRILVPFSRLVSRPDLNLEFFLPRSSRDGIDRSRV